VGYNIRGPDNSTVCPVDSRQVVHWDRSSVETGRPSRWLDGWTSRPFSWDKSTYRECCFRPLKIFCQNAKCLTAIEYRSSESSLKDNKVLIGWQWWPLLGCRLVRRLGQMRSRERANDNNAQLITMRNWFRWIKEFIRAHFHLCCLKSSEIDRHFHSLPNLFPSIILSRSKQANKNVLI
jgi:hypothetical protein